MSMAPWWATGPASETRGQQGLHGLTEFFGLFDFGPFAAKLIGLRRSVDSWLDLADAGLFRSRSKRPKLSDAVCFVSLSISNLAKSSRYLLPLFPL
jgi:hypothetical protein